MLKRVFVSLSLMMLIGFLSLLNIVNAQTSTPTPTSKGSISGTVKDESGNPVSGAKVSIKRSKKPKFKDSGSTGTQGQFEFSDLTLPGFVFAAIYHAWQTFSTHRILSNSNTPRL